MLLSVFMLIMGLSCASLDAQAEKKDGWSDGYYYIDGKKQTSKWIKDGSKKYYVDSKGKKLTGWHKVGGSYYFFNQKGNNYKTGTKTGVMVTKLKNGAVAMGIDVSQWQGTIDWSKLKKTDVSFVMLRLGYGKGRYGSKGCTVDKRFAEYVDGAVNAGIPIGIYFYSYATTPQQALKEAEFTIEKLNEIPVSLPVTI